MLNGSKKVCRNVQGGVVGPSHWCPEVSAHSLLPICTRREQHRANAKISSSPLKSEERPMSSRESP